MLTLEMQGGEVILTRSVTKFNSVDARQRRGGERLGMAAAGLVAKCDGGNHCREMTKM